MILVVLVVQGTLLCSGWSRVIDAFGDQVSKVHNTSAPQTSSDEGSGQENSRTSNEENIPMGDHDGSHKQALPPKADNRRSLPNIKTLSLPRSFLPNIGHRSLLGTHRGSAEHGRPGANRDRHIVKPTYLFTPPTLSLLKNSARALLF